MADDEALISRMALDGEEEIAGMVARLRPAAGRERRLREKVRRLLGDVRGRGDEGLLDQVRAFDWPCPGPEALRVPAQAGPRALKALSPNLRAALNKAARSIRAFHRRQTRRSFPSVTSRGASMGIQTLPLDSVGLYVPGGRAAYPSTLLMLAIPAQVAGVSRIAVASPAGASGLPSEVVLAAAAMLGLDEIYGLGGAAAVGAFAFGTQTIPRVDKVLGPGNAWVAEAKRQVFGDVGIDAVAGPTELVILSDGSSPAAFVAADLLAQAEHDAEALPLLLTTDPGEPARVEQELVRQLKGSPRASIQRRSLKGRGALVTCASRELACAAARALAPEHVSVQARRPESWAARVPTAAAVFLGPYTPEAAGDYGAGPNHSLPTGGTARFSSPVGVWDFVRYRSYLRLDRRALREAAPWMGVLAEGEGLDGHAASLAVREGRP